MKITRVVINPNGDSYEAWYLNDGLYKDGDYYHDKIEVFMDGFLHGLRYNETHEDQYKLETLNFYHDSEWEYTDFYARNNLEEYIKQLKSEGFYEQ